MGSLWRVAGPCRGVNTDVPSVFCRRLFRSKWTSLSFSCLPVRSASSPESVLVHHPSTLIMSTSTLAEHLIAKLEALPPSVNKYLAAAQAIKGITAVRG